MSYLQAQREAPSMAGRDQIVSRGSVQNRMDELDKALSDLGDALGRHSERISHVVNAAPPSNQALKGDARPTMCPLAERLDATISQLCNYTSRIRALTESVDL